MHNFINYVKKHIKKPAILLLTSGVVITQTIGMISQAGAVQLSTQTSSQGVVTVTTGAAGTFADDFNPFSPNAEDPSHGMIYEPLFFFDTADAGKISPWLGTSYAWSNHGKTITFELRHGVEWTDKKPFTSADVVFTFDLIKNNKALNQYGLPLGKISAEGPYKVVVNFTKSSYADLNYIAGLTYILPQHIWQSIKNPQTFQDTKPVGTGAYEVSSVSGDVMTLTANPNYYMAGMPKVKTYRFESFNGNTSSDLAIESGQLDWAGSYIPNIGKNYLSKNPKFSISDIPLSIAYLVPNMAKGITTNYKIREAISEAINRPFVSKTVYNGYANQTNPESVLLPNFKEILNPALKNDKFTYSVQKAKTILESAGYKMGSNGYFEKNGQTLTVTCKVVSGYTDYVQDLDIIASEEKSAGINFVVQGVSYAEFTSDQDTGNFQLLIDNFGYTPSPYVFFNNLLNGNDIPPIGKIDTAGDFGRYNNPTIDSLLSRIEAAPSVAQQKSSFYQIESTFAKTLPLIPIFDQQDEQEFNGAAVTGEPTLSNPYAASAVYISPDLGWVAMHLVPVAK
ncbi:MAG: ABC transporter substrate-binding protein [Firmicutes bacterium]|nr:ABC transporter substrate-binding protein [Bacillota bacterium]